MLVAAVDTATLTLSCALVDVAPGVPPQPLRQDRAPRRGPRLEGRPARAGGGRTSPEQGSRSTQRSPPAGARRPAGGGGARDPDLEGYAIGLGPGSFTGLRIGLATWKGLAYANRRPIAGASSLAAMALAAAPTPSRARCWSRSSTRGRGRSTRASIAARRRDRGDRGRRRARAAGARGAARRARHGRRRPVAFGEGFDAYASALAGAAGSRPRSRRRPRSRSPPSSRIASRPRPTTRRPCSRWSRATSGASEAELKFPKGIGPGSGA